MAPGKQHGEGGGTTVAIRMRVIKVPRLLGKVLAGVLGVFGWKASPPRQ